MVEAQNEADGYVSKTMKNTKRQWNDISHKSENKNQNTGASKKSKSQKS